MVAPRPRCPVTSCPSRASLPPPVCHPWAAHWRDPWPLQTQPTQLTGAALLARLPITALTARWDSRHPYRPPPWRSAARRGAVAPTGGRAVLWAKAATSVRPYLRQLRRFQHSQRRQRGLDPRPTWRRRWWWPRPAPWPTAAPRLLPHRRCRCRPLSRRRWRSRAESCALLPLRLPRPPPAVAPSRLPRMTHHSEPPVRWTAHL